MAVTKPANAHVGRLLELTVRPAWTVGCVDYEGLKRLIKPDRPDRVPDVALFDTLLPATMRRTETYFVPRAHRVQEATRLLSEATARLRTEPATPRMLALRRAATDVKQLVTDLAHFAAVNEYAVIKVTSKPHASPLENRLHRYLFAAPPGYFFKGPMEQYSHAERVVAEHRVSPADERLLEALQQDRADVLQQLLPAVPTAEVADWLVEACHLGAVRCFEVLRQLANPFDARETLSGRSLLAVACANNQTAMVELLLPKHAPHAMQPDWLGHTPLRLTLARADNVRITAALINAGGVERTRDSDDATIPFLAAVLNRPAVLAEVLMRSGPHAIRGERLLAHQACMRGFAHVLEQVLMNSGAELNEVDAHGRTCLHVACIYGRLDCVNELLSKPAGRNLINVAEPARGRTPLMLAAHYGHAAIVDALVEAGAQPRIHDLRGWVAFSHALYQGHVAIAKKLMSATQPPPQAVLHKMRPPTSTLPPLRHLREHEAYLVLKVGGYTFKPTFRPGYAVDEPYNYSHMLVFAAEDMEPQTGFSMILPAQGNPSEMIFLQRHESAALKIEINLCSLFLPDDMPVARGMIFFSSLKTTLGSLSVPLMTRTGSIGVVHVDFFIVRPFVHPANVRDTDGPPAWTPVKLIGHRGTGADKYCKEDAQHIPENTVHAFNEAAKHVRMVEFDVHVMRDGVPVVFHDFRVGRAAFDFITTDLTSETLRELNTRVRGCGPASGREHEAIPTLEEVFQMVEPSLGFNIEVKYPNAREIEHERLPLPQDLNGFVNAVLDVVFRHKEQRRDIIFSSFMPGVCVLLAAKQSTYPVFFLTDAGWFELYSDYRSLSLHEGIRFARRAGLHGLVSWLEPLWKAPEVCTPVLAAGLQLVTYGQGNNQPDVGRRELTELGFDAIISDHVAKMRAALVRELQ